MRALPLQAKTVAYFLKKKTFVVIDISAFQKTNQVFIQGTRRGKAELLRKKPLEFPKSLGKYRKDFSRAKIRNMEQLHLFVKKSKASLLEHLSMTNETIHKLFGNVIESRKKFDSIELIGKKDGKNIILETVAVQKIETKQLQKDLKMKLTQRKGFMKLHFTPLYQTSGVLGYNIFRSSKKQKWKKINKYLKKYLKPPEKRIKKHPWVNQVDKKVRKDEKYTYRVDIVFIGAGTIRGPSVTGVYFDRKYIKVAPLIISAKSDRNQKKITLSWTQKYPYMVKHFEVLNAIAYENEKAVSEKLLPETRSFDFVTEKYRQLHVITVKVTYIDDSSLKSINKKITPEPPAFNKTTTIEKLEFRKKDKGIYLKWKPLKIPKYARVSGYIVARSLSEKKFHIMATLPINQTEYIDKYIDPNHSYQYAIWLDRGKKGFRNRGPARKIKLPNWVPPKRVAYFRSKPVRQKKKGYKSTLIWDHYQSAVVKSYRIYRSNGKKKPALMKILPVTIKTWEDLEVIQGGSYEYFIEAVNGSNVTSGRSSTTLKIPFRRPENIIDFNIYIRKNGLVITWKWYRSQNKLGINVYKSAGKGKFKKLNDKPISISKSEFVDTKIKKGKNAYYHVTTVNKHNIESTKSKTKLGKYR